LSLNESFGVLSLKQDVFLKTRKRENEKRGADVRVVRVVTTYIV
jgi:hypothetical protein